jgi:hypothetical protein
MLQMVLTFFTNRFRHQHSSPSSHAFAHYYLKEFVSSIFL